MRKKIFFGIVIFLIVVYLANFILIKASYKDIESLKDDDSKFVSVCGIDIHYKTYGNGVTTLLLIHGFGASTYSFNEVSEMFSKNYKVIALDLPGFGLTERVSNSTCNIDPYSREGQVEIVKSFIDTIKLENVYLVGHSMGGTVSTIFAMKYPNLIKGVILEDPAIFEQGGSPKIIVYVLKNPIGRIFFTMITYPMVLSLQSLINKAFYDKSKVTLEKIKEYKKSLRVKNWDYGLYRIVSANNQVDFINRISEIKLRVLIINGENDTIVKPEDSEKLSDMITNSKFVSIDECGHIPHEEKPEVFVHAVRSFIEKSSISPWVPVL